MGGEEISGSMKSVALLHRIYTDTLSQMFQLLVVDPHFMNYADHIVGDAFNQF